MTASRLDLITAADLPMRFGRYQLQSVLGEGGMARVFRAELLGPAGFRKQVAVKVIKAEASSHATSRDVASFIREARLGGLLKHPNIVDVYELGGAEGQFFLSMELVNGPTLSALIRSQVPAPPAVVIEIAVSMVATIVNDLCSRNGSYFNLTIAGTNASHFSATPSQNVTRAVLESLAVINPGNGVALRDSFQWLSHEGQQGMTVVIVSTRSKQQAITQLEQISDSVTNVTQQGWSLQDALWIDCQDHLEVDRFFQPFETTNTMPTERTPGQDDGQDDGQGDGQGDPLIQSGLPNVEAEMSLTTEEVSHLDES